MSSNNNNNNNCSICKLVLERLDKLSDKLNKCLSTIEDVLREGDTEDDDTEEWEDDSEDTAELLRKLPLTKSRTQ